MNKPASPPRSSLPALKPKLPALVPDPAAPEGTSLRDIDRAAHAALARITGGVSPHATTQALSDWALHLARAPGRQAELALQAQTSALALATHATRLAMGMEGPGPFAPKKNDPRFDHPGWQIGPFSLWQQGFLAMQDWWASATQGLPGLNPANADRTAFMIRQTLDLASPSNSPWMNPEIIEETGRRQGVNMVEGAMHFFRDFAHTVTQTPTPPPAGFEIGKDLACTPGKVVFRNDLFELIQYAPQTKKVQAEPVLIVPAWIMKYYILDLSSQNSLIRHLVCEGFTVFAVSWVNPTADQADLSLEDYRTRGVMRALDAIGGILPGRRVHANGYCLGGTMLAIAAATMARDGDDRLATVTLMAAQVDFAEAGELSLFVDDSQVAFLEDMMWDQGFLDRPQMSRTFATIRAEDLIYTRAVRRYYLAKEDLPSDLTVWNNDTTRMPAQMHSEYLRSLFLENRLSAGRFAVEGRVIALKDISVPMFVIGTETDHIAPWRSVYKTKLFTDCDLRFVLTSSGHNGGILSEPGHPRRHYRIGHREVGAHYMGPDMWLDEHPPIAGSWWPEWFAWLQTHSAELVKSPETGAPAAGYPPICAAPGTYVHQT